MKHFMNKGHMQFDLLLGGVPQQVIGKMISCDSSGCVILLENNGQEHFYAAHVIQHICEAP